MHTQDEQNENLISRAKKHDLVDDVQALITAGLETQAEKLISAYEQKTKTSSSRKDEAEIRRNKFAKALATATQSSSKASRVVQARIAEPDATAADIMSAADVASNYTLEANAAQRTILNLYNEGLLSEEYTKQIQKLLGE